MVTCSVSDCGVNNRNNPENCTFHRFPLDTILRGEWLRLIGRVGWNPKKNSTICSKHFPDEYKRKRRINTVLVKGAIPTLFVPGHIKERIPSSYINRDIALPSISQAPEKSVQLTPRTKKLISKNDAVEYIAGFVVKKIKIKISCEECCNALQSSRQCSSQESFINKRDFSSKADQGFLTYPSKDVIQLCLKIEKFIRENKKITQAIGKSTICKAVLLILEDNSGLFSSLENHNLDQDILSGHRYLIMKYVIEIYFEIRLKYECKLNYLGKETVRNQFNKIVLFKGQ